MKLLVIGHDGLDLEVLKQGSYSTIEKLVDGGTFTRMKSVYRSTVPSWISIYTGLTAENHGYMGGWGDWIKNRRRISGCYWDEFNERGYSTGVFSMPLTYPPQEVDGWMVSGFPTPFNNIGLTYPKTLDRFMRGYLVDIVQPLMTGMGMREPEPFVMNHVNQFHKMEPEKIMKETIDAKVSTLEKILAIHPVDVVSMGFSFVDHANHLHCPDEEAYSLVDYSISEGMKVTGAENVVIVSDHGTNHTENGVLITNWKIPEQDYREWEVTDVILGGLQ